MHAYRGSRFQRGYGLGQTLRSLWRTTLMPALKAKGNAVKQTLTRKAKETAKDLLKDVIPPGQRPATTTTVKKPKRKQRQPKRQRLTRRRDIFA